MARRIQELELSQSPNYFFTDEEFAKRHQEELNNETVAPRVRICLMTAPLLYHGRLHTATGQSPRSFELNRTILFDLADNSCLPNRNCKHLLLLECPLQPRPNQISQDLLRVQHYVDSR